MVVGGGGLECDELIHQRPVRPGREKFFRDRNHLLVLLYFEQELEEQFQIVEVVAGIFYAGAERLERTLEPAKTGLHHGYGFARFDVLWHAREPREQQGVAFAKVLFLQRSAAARDEVASDPDSILLPSERIES